MIVRDEAYFLDRCLGAVRDYVDEMIVVDTGSTDRTREIARAAGATLYDYQWDDDFSHARNFSLSKASGDWILVLDADEWMAPEDMESLRRLIRDTDYDAFFLQQFNYSNNPLEKDWVPVKSPSRYSAQYLGYRINPIARLFRNRQDIRYRGRVHEVIDPCLPEGSYTTLAIPIHHHIDGDPNKPKHERQLNYLRIIEDTLRERPDGRLAASAGAVYMYHKQDYRKAIGYFRQAVELGHEREENLEALAEAYYRLKDYAQSYQIYRQLFESGYRTFSLCNNLANLLVKQGHYLPAAKMLRLALSMGVVGEDVAARLQHNISFLEEKGAAAGEG